MSNKLSTKIQSLYLCPGVYILLKWAFSLIWLFFLTDEIPLFLCVCDQFPLLNKAFANSSRQKSIISSSEFSEEYLYVSSRAITLHYILPL